MTVAELIKQLQKLPADLPVYLGDWNEQYAPDSPMGDDDGPWVNPPRDIKQQGILVGALPERVVIGGVKP
jgi:hypothetical protein